MNTIRILTGEELCKKIETLKGIYVDNKYWETFYLDEETREIWVKYHPYPEMQAGGPSELIPYGDYLLKQKNSNMIK